jgi:hypothetical protein
MYSKTLKRFKIAGAEDFWLRHNMHQRDPLKSTLWLYEAGMMSNIMVIYSGEST